jgi:exonuclease V gamma subunit
MYSKVSLASNREDVENSIRVKLDSIENIFAEVLTLPTSNFRFEKVISLLDRFEFLAKLDKTDTYRVQ